MWFKKLMGFNEISPDQVRENIYIEGNKIISRINNNSFQFGSLEIPTLKELKESAAIREDFQGTITIHEVIGNVQDLHKSNSNKNALFQAASQFNLLEMVGPHVTPERGIDIYENDHTQGPSCAIACGAGTIYRNYYAPVNGKIGQSFNNQIDCLQDVGKIFNNEELHLWKMRNGYALPNQEGLLKINSLLSFLDREMVKEKLKVGIQWNTEVTLVDTNQIVSQVYCSALPVAYSKIDSIYWEKFARIILEATYEATLYAGLINLEKTDCNKVFLTLVGGGAFGNDMDWIIESMEKSLFKFKNTPLDVYIVSYKESSRDVKELVEKFN